MKKILFLVVIMTVFSLAVTPVMAVKPVKCATIQGGTITDVNGNPISVGYDQWGYNYQANMFNGLYDNFSRPASPSTTGDRLMMKWNDAWLSNQDCSGDSKLDRHYGFPTYRGSGAWLTNHQSGTYQGKIISWDVTGTWLLDFAGGTDNRQFRDLVQDEEGNVTGEFYYLTASDWAYGGTLVGNVTGDILTLHYDRDPIPYIGDFEATISETGLVNGNFTDSHGNNLTWTATGVDPAVHETCSWNYFVKIVAAPADAHLDLGVWYTADNEEIGPVIWGEFAITQEVSNDACAEQHGLQYKGVRPGLGNW